MNLVVITAPRGTDYLAETLANLRGHAGGGETPITVWRDSERKGIRHAFPAALRAHPGPALVLDDDVIGCHNAVPAAMRRMAETPDMILRFYSYRPHQPGLRAAHGRFGERGPHGNLAIYLPAWASAHVVEREGAITGLQPNSRDGLLNRVLAGAWYVEPLPSLFQHVGVVSAIVRARGVDASVEDMRSAPTFDYDHDALTTEEDGSQ